MIKRGLGLGSFETAIFLFWYLLDAFPNRGGTVMRIPKTGLQTDGEEHMVLLRSSGGLFSC